MQLRLSIRLLLIAVVGVAHLSVYVADVQVVPIELVRLFPRADNTPLVESQAMGVAEQG
jgi:hypothetical protein